MQRAETAARSVSRRGELLEGEAATNVHALHTHTHSRSYADLPVSTFSQWVWHAVTFLPLLPPGPSAHSSRRPSTHWPLLGLHYTALRLSPCPCLVSSFCFQTGVKETNHLHTAHSQLQSRCRFLFPAIPAPYSQQINGHNAFLPARRLVELGGGGAGKFTRPTARGRGTQPQLVCIAPKIIAHINC